MSNIDVEKVYHYSNYCAFILSMIALGAVLYSTEVSPWIPLIILAIPTILFSIVVAGALVWSFILPQDKEREDI